MMTHNVTRTCSTACLVVLFSACSRAPKERATAPSASPLGSASAAPERSPTPGAAGATWKYAFSAADSKIEFVGARVSGKHHGSFASFTGTVQVPSANLERSAVQVDVDLQSLTTDDPKLTAWLKSSAFFDVAKYPRAHFVSNSLRQGGEEGATNTAVGTLELHGVTRPLDVPVTAHVRPDAVDVDAEMSLSLSQFGFPRSGKPSDLLDDKVVLNLSISARREPH